MPLVKISKAQAGYQYHPETEYLCGECVMLKPLPQGGTACAWFGPNDPVSAERGSCIYFAHSHGKRYEIPWLALFTKVQLGYGENRCGFSCKRCVHIDLIKEDCERVDKDSPGDTPGEIDPMSCCDVWEPDKKRAGMTTEKLLELIASLQKGAGKMEPGEYRKLRESGDL